MLSMLLKRVNNAYSKLLHWAYKSYSKLLQRADDSYSKLLQRVDNFYSKLLQRTDNSYTKRSMLLSCGCHRSLPEGTGWVIDGFPTTYTQAKLLEKALSGFDAGAK